MSENDLKNTDKREKAYIRKLIEINIWVYINEFNTLDEMNKNFPIVQSYVDLCINGCLEIEEKFEAAKQVNFTKMFIKSTVYWNNFWVNDRIYPRRPFIHCPNANMIDAYLKDFWKTPHYLIKFILNNLK